MCPTQPYALEDIPPYCGHSVVFHPWSQMVYRTVTAVPLTATMSMDPPTVS